MHYKGGDCVNQRGISSCVMTIYLGSNWSNEVDMGDGDDISIVKELSGFHISEVDGMGSMDGQGWSWLEIGFTLLTIKLRLVCSSVLNFFSFTKKVIKKKLACAKLNFGMSNKDVTPANPPVLQISALP